MVKGKIIYKSSDTFLLSLSILGLFLTKKDIFVGGLFMGLGFGGIIFGRM